MQEMAPAAWNASVDYIRMTWRVRGDYEHLLHDVTRIGSDCGREAVVGRAEPAEQKLLGYRGWQTGKVFVGHGPQGILLQASGLAAQCVAERRMEPDNVPRIDIQSTFWHSISVPWCAEIAASEAVGHRKKVRGGRTRINLISGHGHGDTAYIGTRGARSKYLRVYDKHAESKSDEYRNAWRYEAELTDEHAVLCYHSLMETGLTPEAVGSLVRGYFGERGVGIPAMPGTLLIRPQKPVPDPDARARRLAWFRNYVQPSILKHLAEGGTMEEVREALGLT